MGVLRVGLVGVGVHGTRYARHLLAGDVPGLALGGICRRDEARGLAFAREAGLAFHRDAAALAASADAVVVASPPSRHLEHALAAIGAGRPVLVEKPLATTSAEARRMVEAARRAGVPLMTAESFRYDPAVQAVRERLPGLGTLRRMTLFHRQEPFAPDREGAWEVGVHLEIGVHLLDALLWMTGEEIADVRAVLTRPAGRAADTELAAILTLGSGAIALLDASVEAGGRNGLVEAVGSGAVVRADPVGLRLEERRGREVRREELAAAAGIPLLLADFARAARREAPPAISGEDGLRAVEAAERCEAAARRVTDP